MQVKRYCCPDVREALRLVRRELGPDAVVIGTRERPDLPGGRHGRPLIEVTAAVDREEADRNESARNGDDSNGAGGAPAAAVPEWLVDVLREDGLDRRLAGMVVAEAAQLVPEDMATTARLRAAVAVTLRRRTCTAPPPWKHEDERVLWFVGPAGAGKTTTVAKVAAFAAWQERQRVAILTLDTARPGTTVRLRALAGAMDVPVHEVADSLALREQIARLKDVDRILIDAPPPNPTMALDELAAAIAAAGGRTHLCLPADGATRSLLATASRWGTVGVDAVVATRVDLAATLGAAFAAHHALAKPLALLTTGPSVPDDVEMARPEAVCRRILIAGPGDVPGGSPKGPGPSREEDGDARIRHVA